MVREQSISEYANVITRSLQEYGFYDLRPLVSVRTGRVLRECGKVMIQPYEYLSQRNKVHFLLYLAKDLPHRTLITVSVCLLLSFSFLFLFLLPSSINLFFSPNIFLSSSLPILSSIIFIFPSQLSPPSLFSFFLFLYLLSFFLPLPLPSFSFSLIKYLSSPSSFLLKPA